MTQKEFIPACQFMFGGTKKEAINYYKTASEEAKKSIVDHFYSQAKSSFYSD